MWPGATIFAEETLRVRHCTADFGNFRLRNCNVDRLEPGGHICQAPDFSVFESKSEKSHEYGRFSISTCFAVGYDRSIPRALSRTFFTIAIVSGRALAQLHAPGV